MTHCRCGSVPPDWTPWATRPTTIQARPCYPAVLSHWRPHHSQLDRETTALSDEELTGDDEDGVGQPGEVPFMETLRTETQCRREFAEAFTR